MDDQAFALLMDKLKSQDERFEAIETKLDELLSWKLKLSGAVAVITIITTAIMQYFYAKIGG